MRLSMKLFLMGTVVLAAGLVIAGCHESHSDSTADPSPAGSALNAFSPDRDLFIDASASRLVDGRIVISGSTNLPEGLKLWVNVEEGKLPLGAPKSLAGDENVIVHSGKITTQPLWMAVPNTRFTKTGWPTGINVNDREVPFPARAFKVHFVSYFNGAWQSKEIIAVVGGEGAKPLKGKIIKAENPDVIDSSKIVDYTPTFTFPPLSPEGKAISLVRAAIMTVPDEGRSTGDVQAVVDMFMVSPGLKIANGWAAKKDGATTYTVSFDFINGSQGEQQALWQADLATGKVKYVNENGKLFSWAPSY